MVEVNKNSYHLQAREALSSYLDRGDAVLHLLQSGDFLESVSMFRKMRAAFYNFYVADVHAEQTSFDNAENLELVSKFEKMEKMLLPLLKKYVEKAQKDLTAISRERQRLKKFRSWQEPVNRLRQTV